jgi:hypothetical protein
MHNKSLEQESEIFKNSLQTHPECVGIAVHLQSILFANASAPILIDIPIRRFSWFPSFEKAVDQHCLSFLLKDLPGRDRLPVSVHKSIRAQGRWVW